MFKWESSIQGLDSASHPKVKKPDPPKLGNRQTKEDLTTPPPKANKSRVQTPVDTNTSPGDQIPVNNNGLNNNKGGHGGAKGCDGTLFHSAVGIV